MKHLLKIMLLLLPGLSLAQDKLFNQVSKKQVDSLQLALQYTGNDTIKMLISDDLGNYYIEKNNTASFYYFKQDVALASKIKQKLMEAADLDGLSYIAYLFGNYSESLKFANAGVKIAENEACEKNMVQVTRYAMDGDPHKARLYVLANLYEKLANLYGKTGNNAKSLSSYFKSVKIAGSVDDKVGLSFYNGDLGNYYLEANKLDSALFFLNKSLGYSNASGFRLYRGGALRLMGQIYFQKGNLNTAKIYFFESIKTNKEQNNQQYLPYAYISLADLYKSTGKFDSCIYYVRLALGDFKNQKDKPGISEAYTILFAAYKLEGQTDSAFLYLQRSKTLGDSLNEAEKTNIRQYMNIGFDEQLKVEELEKEKIQVQTRIRTYVLLTGIGIFVIIAFILYRNNKQKQKSNQLLRQQKEKVESTLTELKSTQAQLIQSEKMASLGELTAGIAHEIQNPLNFVNNFSEVNKEMLVELNEEIDKGNYDDVKSIAKDVIANEEKINHHGKRADSIVKGMLEHSKASTGKKELTDINKLADEYLRLSYHGLRAKDKSFNAEMVTDFDENIGKINIIPQDLGRVLLNLYNNAFYAISEKKKQQANGYEPTISVSTKKMGDKVVLTVKDNGNGIPQKVIDKIFQPFFTTKPTGSGTGLGLSLSYDIVKAHAGEIKVNTIEGEFTEFVVQLPVSV